MFFRICSEPFLFQLINVCCLASYCISDIAVHLSTKNVTEKWQLGQDWFIYIVLYFVITWHQDFWKQPYLVFALERLVLVLGNPISAPVSKPSMFSELCLNSVSFKSLLKLLTVWSVFKKRPATFLGNVHYYWRIHLANIVLCTLARECQDLTRFLNKELYTPLLICHYCSNTWDLYIFWLRLQSSVTEEVSALFPSRDRPQVRAEACWNCSSERQLLYIASALCNVFAWWINGLDFQCHKSGSSTAFKSNACIYKK